jgi:hypothetical protein
MINLRAISINETCMSESVKTPGNEFEIQFVFLSIMFHFNIGLLY